MMKQLFPIVFTALCLTSCYKEIDLDEYRTTPRMVINSTVSPDAVVMASVTRTWFYPETKPYVNLPHARVELYINDRYVESMQWKTVPNPHRPERPDTLFASNTVPSEGDRIRIVASTPEYGTAVAEDIIPRRVPIESVRYTIRKGEGLYADTYTDYYEIFYEVTFNDAPEPGNYYLIRVMSLWNDSYYGSYWQVADMDYIDPVCLEQDAILDGSMGFDGLNKGSGALFTDQSINGQTYTLQAKETAIKLEQSGSRIIALYSLSESYFLYLLSLQKIAGSTLEGGLGNIGFAEPLRVYSNVEGGVGILGGNHHSETRIILKNNN